MQGILERLGTVDERHKETACKIAGMLFLADLPEIGPYRQFDEYDTEAMALAKCKSVSEVREALRSLHTDNPHTSRLVEAIAQLLGWEE